MTIITTFDLGDGSATAETVAGQTMTVFDGGTGPAGPGVAEGGSTGQVLAKASSADYDTEWVDQTGGGGGGAVDSVNGHTGVVVLAASDVGADASGAAASALATAEAYTDTKVSTEVARADAAYDAAGSAASALTTAETYTDTAISGEVTRADAAYDAAGAAASAQAAAVSAAATDATSKVAAEATARTAAIATQHTADVAAFDAAGAAATAQAAAATDATTKANAAQAFAIQRGNHTGTQSADTLTDGTTNKAFLATERTKLSGIATGATANSSDATLLARANHTGTESADVLTDGTTNKAFLATERTKLTGIATGATANDTDANLKNRANHTGTQTLSTISDAGTAAAVNTGTTSGTVPLLSTGGVLPIARLATGTPDGTKFVRDDGTLATPTGAAAAVTEAQVTATVAFRASATGGTANSSSPTLAMPTGAVAGDLLLLFVTTLTAWTITTPSGWTLLRTDVSTGGTNNTRQAVFWKIATAADPGATQAVGLSGSGRASLTVLAYSGASQSAPIDAHGATVSSADGTTATAPSVTTTVANSRVVECFGAAAAAAITETVTAPATSRTSMAVASNFVGHATSDQATASSAGATGTTAATLAGTGSWVAVTIAIVPSNASDDLSRKATVGTSLVNTVAASSTAQAIPDTTSAIVNAITLTGNCTFTFPTAVAGKKLRVALKQDATGSRTATWPAAVKWPGGTAPTLTTTAAKTDHFEFTCYDGTNWLGQTLGLNY